MSAGSKQGPMSCAQQAGFVSPSFGGFAVAGAHRRAALLQRRPPATRGHPIMPPPIRTDFGVEQPVQVVQQQGQLHRPIDPGPRGLGPGIAVGQGRAPRGVGRIAPPICSVQAPPGRCRRPVDSRLTRLTLVQDLGAADMARQLPAGPKCSWPLPPGSAHRPGPCPGSASARRRGASRQVRPASCSPSRAACTSLSACSGRPNEGPACGAKSVPAQPGNRIGGVDHAGRAPGRSRRPRLRPIAQRLADVARGRVSAMRLRKFASTRSAPAAAVTWAASVADGSVQLAPASTAQAASILVPPTSAASTQFRSS